MLKLFNSMSKEIEIFESLEDKKVKMVSCGPSIYQMPHIGNYRTFVFEDILHRYLEYLGYDVDRVITVTDVEDKTLLEAKKQKIPLMKLVDKNISQFIKELEQLKVKIPNFFQRSSTCVEQSVELIEILVKKGYAYWFTYNGRKNIYFDPKKFKKFGKLYGLDISKWPKKKIRFHKDTYPGSRWNRGDFILWHGYKEGDKIYYETKIGKGRPSWNIQDPAMIPKKFNFNVDIWVSGIDSLMRHHDYIIALVESITEKSFAKYWLHAAHLFFNGEKMSKRKGNIKYPRDLIGTQCNWNHIRFFFIYGHYRKKLNFTYKNYNKICKLLKDFQNMVQKFKNNRNLGEKSSKLSKKLIKKLKIDFEKHMNNDLQVKNAFDSINQIIRDLVKLKEKGLVSQNDSKNLLKQLNEIDYVFQTFF